MGGTAYKTQTSWCHDAYVHIGTNWIEGKTQSAGHEANQQ